MLNLAGPIISWKHVDTVLIDMDGVLLDLSFDNFFWRKIIPAKYAKLHGLSETVAQEKLMLRYKELQGKLAWYCIDHWSDDLKLNIRQLKIEYRERIQFLPGATDFLVYVRKIQKRIALVTNAHPDTLAIKSKQTKVSGFVDDVFSSHNFNAPKESKEFWHRFNSVYAFDPNRSVFIDDSVSVLRAARDFGISQTIGITCPDSTLPAQKIEGFCSADGVCNLII
ncbi:MAG: hypothetical protein CMM56_09935 [Rhodospirillaceae bacterium]|nr:hypothetical protein [Rhodospirillaceae bacterium]|tara:strand:+ start:715 stop:1386 length:672 start_codon:yes stop_codon:yes gene_type:complete